MDAKTATPHAYPPTRVEPVEDVYHGEKVVDPFRWLENGEAPEVQAWMKAQNATTRKALDALPTREKLRARIMALSSAPRQDVPVHKGKRYFFKRHDGQSPQAVLMVQDGLFGTGKVLVDPNTLSKDGTVSLDWWSASPEGDYVAYGLSENGDEQSVLHVVDVRTGEKLPDVIPGCRYASVGWTHDQKGFYYTRFPGEGANGKDKQKVFHHELGADIHKDPQIFEHPGGPEIILWLDLSDDDQYMAVYANNGSSSTNELFVWNRQEKKPTFRPVAQGFKASYFGTFFQDLLFIQTTEDAPRGKVEVMNLKDSSKRRELIPQTDDVLQNLHLAGGLLVGEYLHDAHSQLKTFDLTGRPLGHVPLPGLGSVGSVSGKMEDRDLFFSYTSFLEPPSVFRYDIETKHLQPFFRPPLNIDAAKYEERQVWYPSKDGTKVPMFLIHKKGLKANGQNPTLLSGYGGFNISLTPSFSAQDFAWVEKGGVLAVANIRGGGEFGEAWHQGGMREKKQNVFDDFIGAAEYLVKEKITSPAKLAIEGGSNGGLLVGAVLTQRPDLFKAVVCAVPLLDMLRYHQFLIARYWIPEYGSSEDAAQYRYIKAYSPYHQVKPGAKYPATLIVTGESDTRVDPLHARKMAALLQKHQGGAAPIFLYVETKAGHGAGKPLAKRVETSADTMGFVAWQLGLE